MWKANVNEPYYIIEHHSHCHLRYHQVTVPVADTYPIQNSKPITVDSNLNWYIYSSSAYPHRVYQVECIIYTRIATNTATQPYQHTIFSCSIFCNSAIGWTTGTCNRCLLCVAIVRHPPLSLIHHPDPTNRHTNEIHWISSALLCE